MITQKIPKLTPMIVMLFLNAALAIAYDLSEYPNLFRQGEKINVTIVVGDKSAAPNVISLTSIYASLKTRNDVVIQNKITLEIADIKQNIISVGNPCINKITALIMSNPQPCDKDFPKGKAFIKLIDNWEYRYIIVAGYSDAGTRKAADVLANYMDYSLKGNEFVIDVENDQSAAANIGETANAMQKEEIKDFKKQNKTGQINQSTALNNSAILSVGVESVNIIRKELGEQNYTQQINEDKKEELRVASIKDETTAGNAAEGQNAIRIEQAPEEKGNFITRFFIRLISLFRRK